MAPKGFSNPPTKLPEPQNPGPRSRQTSLVRFLLCLQINRASPEPTGQPSLSQGVRVSRPPPQASGARPQQRDAGETGDRASGPSWGASPRGALTRDPHWLDAPRVVPRPHLTLRPEPVADAPGSWEESVPGVLGALRSTRKGGGRPQGDPSPDAPLVSAASVLGPRSSWPSRQAAPPFHKALPDPEGWRCPGSQHRQVDEPESQAGRGHPKVQRRGQRPLTDR